MILLWALKAAALFLGYLGLRPFFRAAHVRRLLGALCFSLAALLPLAEAIVPVRVSLHVTNAPVEAPGSSSALFWIWLAGLGWAFVSFGLGWLAVRRLYRRSRPLTPEGRLRIAETSALGTAITWGWPHAIVLLPAESVHWSPGQMQAVVLHELAHVRRGDILFHTLALLVRGALWFNPLAWVAVAKFRDDFEAAADEAVLDAGVRPTDYAGVLLSMAGGYRGSAALAAVRDTHLAARIKQILAPRPSTRKLAGFLCACLFTGLFLGVAPAQLSEPHGKAWLEGYEAARRYVAEHGPGGSGSPHLTAEQRRDIELEAGRRLRLPD